MFTVLVVVQVLVSVALIGFILIQHGKGADAGAAFGSGASGTVFGSRGSANFLSRATGVLAALFFLTSLSLAYVVHGQKKESSVMDAVAKPTAEMPAKVDAPVIEVPAAVAPTDTTPKVPE
ncbi:MAG: preprotein translocase subunit SecG [Pseudomonadota bacterium]